jgi:hypothetical protein
MVPVSCATLPLARQRQNQWRQWRGHCSFRCGPYRFGRDRSWVKSKCSQRQEFVIAGYVPASTSRKAIGPLVLDYYKDGKLIRAGRFGTGRA